MDTECTKTLEQALQKTRGGIHAKGSFNEGAFSMNTPSGLLQGLLKRLRTLSIHVQLTIWYLTIFLLLILLFGAIFYFNLRSGLIANLDSQLQLRAQFVSGSVIQEDGGALTLHDKTGELSPLIDTDD